MNEFLADLYGTNEIIGSDEQDLEKDAAANFLIKIAEEQDIDLGECSDDEIAELYAAVEGEMQKEASDEGEIDDEAQTKLAEADFLGRAMAHAYVAELDEIEKQAASGGSARPASKVTAGPGVQPSAKDAAKYEEALKKTRNAQRNAAAYGGSSAAGQGSSGGRSVGAVEGKARELGSKAQRVAKRIGQFHRTGASELAGAVRGGGGASKLQRLARGGKALGRFAPAAALTGLTGLAAYKALSGGKEKKSFDEQFEDAAAERANAWLESQGYDVEKVAEAQIEEALDERAIEMLVEAGYIE